MRLWIALAALGLALAVVPDGVGRPGRNARSRLRRRGVDPGRAPRAGRDHGAGRQRVRARAPPHRPRPRRGADQAHRRRARSTRRSAAATGSPTCRTTSSRSTSRRPTSRTRPPAAVRCCVTGDGIVVAGVDAAGRAAVVKLTPDRDRRDLGPARDRQRRLAPPRRWRCGPTGGSSSPARRSSGPGVGIFLAELTAGGHRRERRRPAIRRRPPPTSTGSSTCACRPAGRPSWRARPSARSATRRRSARRSWSATGRTSRSTARYGPIGLGAPVTLARLEPLPGGGFAIVGGAGATVRSLIVDADGLGDGVGAQRELGHQRRAARDRARAGGRVAGAVRPAGRRRRAHDLRPPAAGRHAPTCAGTRPPRPGSRRSAPGWGRGGSSTPCGTATRRWRSSRAARRCPSRG